MERILSIKEQAYGEDDPRIRSALYSAGAGRMLRRTRSDRLWYWNEPWLSTNESSGRSP